MMVRHLGELISTPNGSEKRQLWLRRPGAFRATVRRGALIIHSLMSFTSGMLGIVEISKMQSDVSEYWV